MGTALLKEGRLCFMLRAGKPTVTVISPAGVESESARPSEEDHRLPGRQTLRGATGKAAAVLAAESESLFVFPAWLMCLCGARSAVARVLSSALALLLSFFQGAKPRSVRNNCPLSD